MYIGVHVSVHMYTYAHSPSCKWMWELSKLIFDPGSLNGTWSSWKTFGDLFSTVIQLIPFMVHGERPQYHYKDLKTG